MKAFLDDASKLLLMDALYVGRVPRVLSSNVYLAQYVDASHLALSRAQSSTSLLSARFVSLYLAEFPDMSPFRPPYWITE